MSRDPHTEQRYSRLRRIRLFIHDYLDHMGVAWSLARSRDCERSYGHRWDSVSFDNTMQSWGKTCSRCRTWQSESPPVVASSSTITVYPNATSVTSRGYGS